MDREHLGILGHILPSQSNYYPPPSSSPCHLQLKCHFQLLDHDHATFLPCPPYHIPSLGKANHLFMFISHSYFRADRKYEKQNKAMAVGFMSLILIICPRLDFQKHTGFHLVLHYFPFPLWQVSENVSTHSILPPLLPSPHSAEFVSCSQKVGAPPFPS